MTEHYEPIGTYKTFYHEMGEGKEQVLLIHGSGLGVSAWANWRVLMPLLAEQYHVFALDLLGFGKSEKPAIRYSKEVWIEHIIRFIETKMTPPVNIVGNSLGGILALHVSLRRPDLVKRQILMGAPGLRFELTEGLDIAWGTAPSMENMRSMIRTFAYDQSMAEDDELVRIRHEASIAEGVPETFASMFPAPRQRHIDDLVLSADDISRIQQPTLLLHGREDRVIPVEVSWEMANVLPNVELHTFSQCGHWIQIEKRIPFYQSVKAFLERDV